MTDWKEKEREKTEKGLSKRSKENQTYWFKEKYFARKGEGSDNQQLPERTERWMRKAKSSVWCEAPWKNWFTGMKSF